MHAPTRTMRGTRAARVVGSHGAPRRYTRRVFAPLLRAVRRYALLASLVALLVAGLVYPVALTVRGAFFADPAAGTGFTLANLALVFADPVQRDGLVNSLAVATGTTALAIALGLPLAGLSARCRFPFKRTLGALVLAPLILPPFVGAIGVRAILGRAGALNALLGTQIDFLGGGAGTPWLGPFGDGRLLAVIVVEALALFPIIFLNASAALANVDPAMDEAARSLGANARTRWRRITLPLIRPGLFAGATIVFIWAFTELGTPLMLDYYRVTPVQVFNGLKDAENNAQPYALTLVMLAASLAIYVAGRSLLGRGTAAEHARASTGAVERPLVGWRGGLAAGAFAAVAILALIPHLGVVLTSVSGVGEWYRSVLPRAVTADHYRQALSSPDSFRSITNSLGYASMAMVLDAGLGLAVGYIIVRTRLRGRGVLDALCMAPLAVPGLVMAFGYVAMSLRWPFGDGPLGTLASVLGVDPHPLPLLVAAYAVRRLPYIVRATVAGLEQTPVVLEEAAVNLGASRFAAVRRVLVPLIAANLIAGGLLVFSFSMLEVSDSLILAQQAEDYPITKQIFAFSERLGDGPGIAAAMGVWGMALLAVTLLAASGLIGRRLGAMFRV